MKVSVIYRPESDHARKVTEFERDFEQRTGKKIELINIDSKDGYATASIYDVLSYPAVLARTDDGQLLKVWQGMGMPLIDEVSYYASSS